MTSTGLERLPSTFTYAQALDAGLSHHRLYSLRDTGAITGCTACATLERSSRSAADSTGKPMPSSPTLTSWKWQRVPQKPRSVCCQRSRDTISPMPYPLDTTSRCLATNGIRGYQESSNGTASRQRRLTSGGQQFRSTTPRPSVCTAPPGPSWTPTACGTRPARMSPTRRYADGFMAVANPHN